MRIPIGSTITCKAPVDAYYSNYGGNPSLVFTPGMLGTLKAYMPCVRGPNTYFAVVDYIDETGKERRVGLNLNNVKTMKGNEK